MKVVVFLLVVVLAFAEPRPSKDTKDVNYWRDFIEEIPDEDKPTFYKQQLFKGYHIKTNEDNNYIYNVPDDVTLTIYTHFLENNKITNVDEAENFEDIICFPNGDCIDTDDPGYRPF